ncbi:helix-turn-helix domain-containing protein [Enterococcus casseliflavus]|uniref:helix-turn-helix domain-containing protein n=1 Tax=Enterococcus casseliflavus TaxID=37734 RepID=UPI00232C70D7|nr:helix-turn-helix transcriptional regulator [Enterococcus casseliflavus]MDB1689314.1 helix-turn-helix transcriptional regulator [Enterococcus casseliflavus]
MLLQDMLKTLRNTNGYTQEQIANKLFISTQAVSKWENGSSVPTIDNLLALSDLYDVSLDELVQGSPYFKKPYLVGNKFNEKKGMLFLIAWLLISLLFTGFGYQPFWIFLIIFSIGISVVLPTIFNDYWIIENGGISIKKYSTNDLRKLIEMLTNHKISKRFNYDSILSAEIIYEKRVRLSPFDFGFDMFYLQISSKDGQYSLSFDTSVKNFLPQFMMFLKRRGIEVIDDHNVIELLISGKSLYDFFNDPA